MVTIDDGDEGGVSGESLLDALKKAYVFSIEKKADGRFYIEEECDNYFHATLTRDQVLALAEELRALACGA